MIAFFMAIFAPPRHFILYIIAIWVGLSIAEKRTEYHRVSKENLNNIVFYWLIAYVIGGRLSFILANISAFTQSPLNIFSPNPDLFDPSGALLVSILTIVIYGRKRKMELWQTLDSLTPLFATFAIGMALAHLASGQAFGSPSELPWAIEQWSAKRHPSQIYEFLASVVTFSIVRSIKKDTKSGLLFLTFLVYSASFRLFLEAFRGDSNLLPGGVRIAQVASWLVLAATFYMIDKIKNAPV